MIDGRVLMNSFSRTSEEELSKLSLAHLAGLKVAAPRVLVGGLGMGFTLAAGGPMYAVSFVLFSLLAWSAAGALTLGGRWRRLDRGVSWACLAAALAVAATALLARNLEWLDSISSDAARLTLITAILAPAGLAIGGPFPVLLAHHGEPPDRIASLWAINGAASVAGGIVAVLALRVAGSSHALLLAAGLYGAAAAIAPAKARTTT
jgi:hypothetical protein